jgi:hypothetical protein
MGYSMTIWYILCSFGTFFSGFGIMYQEKSGNPALRARASRHIARVFRASASLRLFLRTVVGKPSQRSEAAGSETIEPGERSSKWNKL